MQGVIILNEYTEMLSKTNPYATAFFIGWAISYFAYWIARDHPGRATIALIVSTVFLLLSLFTPKQIKTGERHVVEAYLDVRASIDRVMEKYDIIERRGKIYVLAEKEDE